MQRPVWRCTTAGVCMLGGAPRTHAEPEASHTKARDSGHSQAGGSPRHHLLRQGAARCKDEQLKSARLVRPRNNPVWTFRPLLQLSRNSEVRLFLTLHCLE
ncbi:mCG1042092, isoform CRA_a [Mus musculus]|nr:mCG1042092, isoform CRA_a [Mus musculus]EDL34260.1 mCG1042092, isoform CRA_a [Mus musculus]